jgi:outer membrane biosynthesis protein TonB
LNEHSVLLRGAGRRRFAGWICAALLLSSAVGSFLHAQISEEDRKKRDAFLKAREEMRTVASPTPAAAATPTGKPKPAAKKPKGGKTPTPKPKKTSTDDDEESDEATPKPGRKNDAEASPAKRASPEPTVTPGRATQSAARDDNEEGRSRPTLPVATATPEERTPPRPVTVVTPTATIADLPAQITVEKSGLEQEQGYEPPPPPPPRRGFFARLFPRQASYRYLSNPVIEAIRRAPVQRSRWKFIIIHNSGTRQGNARAFDYYHRRVRRMQNGMAYHFVVGNGTSSGDGQIEIGDRWRRQINGGHVHSDYLNNISIGICLVGDFNRHRPTSAQMEATEELIKYLRERCGKADGRAIGVRPHREMNPPRWATDCPGDAFPYGWFRRF